MLNRLVRGAAQRTTSRRPLSALPLDDGMGQWTACRDPSRPFDVGGDVTQGPLDVTTKKMGRWEIEAHALFLTLVKNRLMNVDELRAGVERLDPVRYAKWGYYDKWASAMANAALARGILSEDELNEALGDVSTSEEPHFNVGAIVRVKDDARPLAGHRKPHLRVPAYIHGAVGVVDAYRGSFADPSFNAFRGTAMPVPLFTVRFTHAALGWGGPDTVCAEVYQSWLEPADDHDLDNANKATVRFPSSSSSSSSDHEHLSRYETEEKAVASEEPETPGERLTAALLEILEKKGEVDLEGFRRMVTAVEGMASPMTAESIGPRIVAKAWKDPDFQRRLLDDAGTALADDFAFTATNSTAATKLVVKANTPQRHHLTVCTLCSCYPLTILGLSPSWYKDVKFRARAVREPRALLKDAFGLDLPSDVAIEVLDSTADCRYMVIPEPPPNVASLSEADLAAFVSRDSMIGVARASNVPVYDS